MATTTRTNRYAATCNDCHTNVPAGTGQLTKAADGWIVRCGDCAALTPEARDAKAETTHTPSADRDAQVKAETAYLAERGYSLFDSDAILHAALVEGGFANPVSVTLPEPAPVAPARARRTNTRTAGRTTTGRRRKACVTGGNCSSHSGRNCGGHNCDAN